MERKEKITQAIFQAIDNVNQLSQDTKIEKSLTTNLIGETATLDSLGLVNLIIAVEEKIEESFGVTITIASEMAMSTENSPFRSIEMLVNYIDSCLEGKVND